MRLDLDTVTRLNFDAAGMTVHEVVAELISHYGVPTDMDQVYSLAYALMPTVLEQRARVAMRATEVIAETTTLGAVVADKDYLPVPFVAKNIRDAVGLSPVSRNVRVEMLDPHSQELARMSIPAWTAPDNPEVVEVVEQRITASAHHRVMDAQREVVHNTGLKNRAKWAWRLTGRENCNACLAKASYGPFWADEAGTQRYTHDNCDCYAELVEDYDSWAGKDTAEELATIIEHNSERAGNSWKNPDWAAIRAEFEMERTDIP